MTQQFESSFSKVSFHLRKLPLKLLLCEENFDLPLLSVCGHLVSASLKNIPAKNEHQQSRCLLVVVRTCQHDINPLKSRMVHQTQILWVGMIKHLLNVSSPYIIIEITPCVEGDRSDCQPEASSTARSRRQWWLSRVDNLICHAQHRA